jgi:hypothetical protein
MLGWLMNSLMKWKSYGRKLPWICLEELRKITKILVTVWGLRFWRRVTVAPCLLGCDALRCRVFLYFGGTYCLHHGNRLQYCTASKPRSVSPVKRAGLCTRFDAGTSRIRSSPEVSCLLGCSAVFILTDVSEVRTASVIRAMIIALMMV